MDEIETWLPIAGYEEFYAVSDQGRVKRLKRRKGPVGKNWPYLQPVPQRSGHLTVSLYRDRQTKLVKIHLLVLGAFVKPRPPGMITRHLNGDPTDNRLSNLTYGTYKENLEDDILNGILKGRAPWKTACLKNHEYTEENTYVDPRTGSRSCKICRRQAFAEWKSRATMKDNSYSGNSARTHP